MFWDHIKVFCFGASYAVAFLVEVIHLLRPRPVLRFVVLGFGCAGLLAHTLFLVTHGAGLTSRQGSLYFLAWIVASFFLYGTLHHRKLAWGLFVLPVVLALVLLGALLDAPDSKQSTFFLFAFDSDRMLGVIHAALLLLAGVGVCVGFVASVMYLVQARRLKTKTLPGKGIKLLSLERLEDMNRRAIIAAFPLLTAGVIIGMALMAQPTRQLQGWTDPRVLGAASLWVVFAVLLYLRYSLHIRGRRVALLTIVAFVLFLVTFAVPHTFPIGQGGPP
jgi:ABC-type transport system involved in cytochrome c biogenesis permease subunit